MLLEVEFKNFIVAKIYFLNMSKNESSSSLQNEKVLEHRNQKPLESEKLIFA